MLDGKALLSRFRHTERQREEPVFGAAFHKLHAQGQLESVEELPKEIILEGAGDCIWDLHRRQFWMGYGTRSDAEASLIVAEQFSVECVGLELADPSFYHLDTAFCSLPSGDVIYYPGAFTASGRHAIEERVAPEQRIVVDRAEAAEFSANAVSFDHCLVMSSCTDALRRNVEERGFTVLATPLHCFLRSGGSAGCLTLRLDHRSDETRHSTNYSSRGAAQTQSVSPWRGM